MRPAELSTPAGRLLRLAALGGGLLLLSCREGAEGPAASAPEPAAAAPAEQASSPLQAPPSGAPVAPDFSLAEVGRGRSFRLSEQRGKVVLIDFWATWCGPCRMAIPHLVELQKRYGGKDFTVVGVSLDQQGEAVVAPFIKSWRLNYPVVIDADGAVARAFGPIRGIPTTVVLDRQGRLVGDYLVGYRPKEAYEALIKKALAGG